MDSSPAVAAGDVVGMMSASPAKEKIGLNTPQRSLPQMKTRTFSTQSSSSSSSEPPSTPGSNSSSLGFKRLGELVSERQVTSSEKDKSRLSRWKVNAVGTSDGLTTTVTVTSTGCPRRRTQSLGSSLDADLAGKSGSVTSVLGTINLRALRSLSGGASTSRSSSLETSAIVDDYGKTDQKTSTGKDVSKQSSESVKNDNVSTFSPSLEQTVPDTLKGTADDRTCLVGRKSCTENDTRARKMSRSQARASTSSLRRHADPITLAQLAELAKRHMPSTDNKTARRGVIRWNHKDEDNDPTHSPWNSSLKVKSSKLLNKSPFSSDRSTLDESSLSSNRNETLQSSRVVGPDASTSSASTTSESFSSSSSSVISRGPLNVDNTDSMPESANIQRKKPKSSFIARLFGGLYGGNNVETSPKNTDENETTDTSPHRNELTSSETTTMRSPSAASVQSEKVDDEENEEELSFTIWAGKNSDALFLSSDDVPSVNSTFGTDHQIGVEGKPLITSSSLPGTERVIGTDNFIFQLGHLISVSNEKKRATSKTEDNLDTYHYGEQYETSNNANWREPSIESEQREEQDGGVFLPRQTDTESTTSSLSPTELCTSNPSTDGREVGVFQKLRRYIFLLLILWVTHCIMINDSTSILDTTQALLSLYKCNEWQPYKFSLTDETLEGMLKLRQIADTLNVVDGIRRNETALSRGRELFPLSLLVKGWDQIMNGCLTYIQMSFEGDFGISSLVRGGTTNISASLMEMVASASLEWQGELTVDAEFESFEWVPVVHDQCYLECMDGLACDTVVAVNLEPEIYLDIRDSTSDRLTSGDRGNADEIILHEAESDTYVENEGEDVLALESTDKLGSDDCEVRETKVLFETYRGNREETCSLAGNDVSEGRSILARLISLVLETADGMLAARSPTERIKLYWKFKNMDSGPADTDIYWRECTDSTIKAMIHRVRRETNLHYKHHDTPHIYSRFWRSTGRTPSFPWTSDVINVDSHNVLLQDADEKAKKMEITYAKETKDGGNRASCFLADMNPGFTFPGEPSELYCAPLLPIAKQGNYESVPQTIEPSELVTDKKSLEGDAFLEVPLVEIVGRFI